MVLNTYSGERVKVCVVELIVIVQVSSINDDNSMGFR